MSATATLTIPPPRVPSNQPRPRGRVCGLPMALLDDVVDVRTRHGITPERTEPERAIGYAAIDLATFVEAYRSAPGQGGAS